MTAAAAAKREKSCTCGWGYRFGCNCSWYSNPPNANFNQHPKRVQQQQWPVQPQQGNRGQIPALAHTSTAVWLLILDLARTGVRTKQHSEPGSIVLRGTCFRDVGLYVGLNVYSAIKHKLSEKLGWQLGWGSKTGRSCLTVPTPGALRPEKTAACCYLLLAHLKITREVVFNCFTG